MPKHSKLQNLQNVEERLMPNTCNYRTDCGDLDVKSKVVPELEKISISPTVAI